MKKAAILLLSLAVLWGCHRNRPEKVARNFLTAYFGWNLEGAMKYADQETRSDLRAILDAAGEEKPARVQPPEIRIHYCLIQGDTAICNFTVMQSDDDANAMSDNLILARENDSWKVKF